MSTELATQDQFDQEERRRGRMGEAERRHRQKMFITMLLDVERMHSREEICRACGISERTYDRWANDPEVMAAGGISAHQVSLATANFAFQHRGTAMSTLVKVMTSSKNDIAKVRAAELMYQWGEEALKAQQAQSSGEDAADVARLLSGQGPTFIIANANMIQQQAGSTLVLETGTEKQQVAAPASGYPRQQAALPSPQDELDLSFIEGIARELQPVADGKR